MTTMTTSSKRKNRCYSCDACGVRTTRLGVCPSCLKELKIWRGKLRLRLGFEPLPGDLGDYRARKEDEGRVVWWDSWNQGAT